MAQHIAFHLAGSAVATPRRRVPSAEVDALIGQSAGWVEDRFGIASRFWAEPDETSSMLGAQAAQAALIDAGWDAGSLDVIVGACGVMEQPIPGTAVLIQRRLGLSDSGIPAFDVNATCLSFLLAFDVVLSGFALGKWRRALIVGADIASAALDFSDPEASAIFGDGAAAVALEAGGPHQLLTLRLATYGEGADHCRLEAGGTRLRPHDDLAGFLARSKFQMDGVGVFKATARRFPAFMSGLLDAANVDETALNSIIPHQASATALEHLKRSIAGAHGKTVDIFRSHGNQIAVSLPHALHTARITGLLAPGSTSLLVGSSAGISLGGAVVCW
ncbi:3-oxoacyl-[acyl-carrier-protein] synthase III C-terminal domain-containing protein [Ramlibacter sp. WS9]|uniref:3-oxoacyl-[acyl-carrier-protein] synthase III C-terminal domain-containing protein n=1 Tax=Ramlibacter sp. WS9 TaxID=1882741 RepID=UPI00114476BE|nr:3-oxoacyl-[acyl-carrier-protein] synthase III C-terminal domain-containing protein [Ramlibacter sp. WS9]ROZ74320.1 3-oxoacyl-ACP synthase [Ramlibacter sp. WS9]